MAFIVMIACRNRHEDSYKFPAAQNDKGVAMCGKSFTRKYSDKIGLVVWRVPHIIGTGNAQAHTSTLRDMRPIECPSESFAETSVYHLALVSATGCISSINLFRHYHRKSHGPRNI